MNGNNNLVKQLLRDGKKVSAAWLQGASPINAEILARAGFDALFIDMEHGPGNIMTLMSQIQAMQGHRAVPFVRTAWNDFVHIKQILDTGAFGLHVPYVNSAKEAMAAVSAAKYPPVGIRGIAGNTRAAAYGCNPMAYLENANAEICVIIAIETAEAVKNLDEILEIKELDGIFIGPMDLATNMGCFANPSADTVQRTIQVVEEKVFASDKFLATIGSSWDDAQQKYERGYQLILTLSDVKVLSQISAEQMREFNRQYSHR